MTSCSEFRGPDDLLLGDLVHSQLPGAALEGLAPRLPSGRRLQRGKEGRDLVVVSPYDRDEIVGGALARRTDVSAP